MYVNLFVENEISYNTICMCEKATRSLNSKQRLTNSLDSLSTVVLSASLMKIT